MLVRLHVCYAFLACLERFMCVSLSLSMCTHTCMPIFKCICISIQYTVYSIQYTVYSIQYTVYSIQYTHTCTLTCTGAYSHVSVCLYSCYIYIYIYIRTHTRTLLWPESVNGSETGMGGATANRSRSRGKACDGERGEESEGHAGYLLTRVREESPLGTTNTLHHCR